MGLTETGFIIFVLTIIFVIFAIGGYIIAKIMRTKDLYAMQSFKEGFAKLIDQGENFQAIFKEVWNKVGRISFEDALEAASKIKFSTSDIIALMNEQEYEPDKIIQKLYQLDENNTCTAEEVLKLIIPTADMWDIVEIIKEINETFEFDDRISEETLVMLKEEYEDLPGIFAGLVSEDVFSLWEIMDIFGVRDEATIIEIGENSNACFTNESNYRKLREKFAFVDVVKIMKQLNYCAEDILEAEIDLCSPGVSPTDLKATIETMTAAGYDRNAILCILFNYDEITGDDLKATIEIYTALGATIPEIAYVIKHESGFELHELAAELDEEEIPSEIKTKIKDEFQKL